MRPLSLSRFQVLCHSLSKVLFKLSLTLLVRYRSSYFVFNLGRHIPAYLHCIPKQCYSLIVRRCDTGVSRFNGLTPSLAQYSQSGLCSAIGLLCTLNFTGLAPFTSGYLCHNSRELIPDSATGSVPLRSPLTEGITVVFFSSAE
jgi:hypothetical protein